jgi:hypothetical protein
MCFYTFIERMHLKLSVIFTNNDNNNKYARKKLSEVMDWFMA